MIVMNIYKTSSNKKQTTKINYSSSNDSSLEVGSRFNDPHGSEIESELVLSQPPEQGGLRRNVLNRRPIPEYTIKI